MTTVQTQTDRQEMSVKEFDKTFGLGSSIDEEKTRFVNRIENTVFNVFVENYEFDAYKELFERVCYQLGEDASEIISQNSFMHTSIPNLKQLSKKDFIQTLRIVVAIYTHIQAHIKEMLMNRSI
jgi:hypothetical protein